MVLEIKVRKLKRKDLALVTKLVESAGISMSELVEMIWPKDDTLIRVITNEERETFKSQLGAGEQLDKFLSMSVANQDAIILKAIDKKKNSDRLFQVVKDVIDQVEDFANTLDELLSKLCDVPIEDIQDLDIDVYFRLIMEVIQGVVGKN